METEEATTATIEGVMRRVLELEKGEKEKGKEKALEPKKDEEKRVFQIKHIAGKELNEEESDVFVEYAEAMGYPTRATIFRGSERDVLVCVPEGLK